ncbi:metal-dependent hydrolase [Pseudoflavitalea sp. G-6-1-2]|uniref:metal-dependent hydrolase n=1 Tax=Pseudoflavitalea sp. G-6-1-2 TaxID=2728841 RepID=UPI00146E92FD|nr:metal-dependent hydrolase [Pseudoflavitalea sp. G-6-1-2]NML21684.1 metal-dependent hydrolase [Pseudoflavitalea sp. G-6-1-2]
MKAKFLGQNCFLFSYNGKNILTDPFYNIQRAASGFDIAAQRIDYVLITHAHGDHIADVKEVLEHHPGATIIGVPEICDHFNHKNYVDLNFSGTLQIDDLKISMVPAMHTSSFPDGSYGGVAAGYIFQLNNQNIYFAGDTGIMADMNWFSEYYGPLAVSILPVGGHYTMCAAKAAYAAAKMLKTKKVIACHFDTFPPIKVDHEEAKQQFAARNIPFVLPALGEEISL